MSSVSMLCFLVIVIVSAMLFVYCMRSEYAPMMSTNIHSRSIVCDILFLDNIEWNEFFKNDKLKVCSSIQDVEVAPGMIVVSCTVDPSINGIFIVIESTKKDLFQLVRIDTPIHGDHFVVKYGKFINITYVFTVSNDVYIATAPRCVPSGAA